MTRLDADCIYPITLPDGSELPLRDVATIERTLVDPAPQSAFYQGDPAIVFAVAMQEGNNVLEFGPRMADKLDEIEAGLPVGMTLDIITFQPEQVEQAVYGVTINVLQPLGIVLAVVVLLLGLRTGLIVGAIVPIVMLFGIESPGLTASLAIADHIAGLYERAKTAA